MKTRHTISLLITATLAGVAIAQIPAVQSILAPLPGRDREILVETFHDAAQSDSMLSNLSRDYAEARQYFRGRSEAYEQASQLLKNYGTPPYPDYQPVNNVDTAPRFMSSQRE